MKVIRGFKIGGLQQKIFNLVLIFILLLIGVYAAVSVYQQRNLSRIVREANEEQQASMTKISEDTMKAVLDASMTKTVALQAYIANDLFMDVKTDVLVLQTVAEGLYEHPELFPAHPWSLPDPKKDGTPSAAVQHEAGVDPEKSESLGLAANMTEMMLSMFENSDKLSSCFIATADGCILFVDDRSGSYVDENGDVITVFETTRRPWYLQAKEAGSLIFTGVERDTFTDIPGLVCAAPVYRDGELEAVVGADIFLTSISDYISSTATESGFLCIVDGNGHVLFSPAEEGTFKTELTKEAQDLQNIGNPELSAFVSEALTGRTDLHLVSIDGKEYYLCGAPMESLNWAVISVVDKELTDQPAKNLLSQYEKINEDALGTFRQGAKRSALMMIILTAVILILAVTAALLMAKRTVRPLESMTRRIQSLSGNDQRFEMEKSYRTGDEIEILAESFANLSKRTQNYIGQITEITAEKERISTELSLATRIQADMLPNIFPAFPERPEFDVFASMDPAKEVGGDFYDFFLIDDRHLGLVIADVSGKGIPAALFMMGSKILVQNCAMAGRSPADVLEMVNNQICENNREEMFVTVWLGILDTVTGQIRAANAGHEYPVVQHEDGRFELMKDRHGLVIGAMEGMKYREYEFTLTPGSRLFVYTDGVPEATNAKNELFGTERMLDALNLAPEESPQLILQNVRKAVDEFVQDAEQFDDLTMLCLLFNGPKARES